MVVIEDDLFGEMIVEIGFEEFVVGLDVNGEVIEVIEVMYVDVVCGIVLCLVF